VALSLPIAHASSGAFSIGVYYRYTGGSSDLSANFYNSGLAADAAGDATYAVLTASPAGLQEGAQAFIQNNNTGPCFGEFLQSFSGTILFSRCPRVSGLLGAWHTIELKVTYCSTCRVYYVQWYLDGKFYNSWGAGSASTFDNQVAPNYAVESYDLTSGDFNNLDTHGYLKNGASAVHTYVYPGLWGASNGCTIPAAYQTTAIYLGSPEPGGTKAPSSVGVIGYVWTSGGYGAPNEWAVLHTTLYTPITDNNLLSYCNAQIS
jgi:hypothetical protein